MSQTQTTRPKRSHVFFMKIILVVFVLIFAGVIGFNVLRGIMIGKAIANMLEASSPVTAVEVKASEWTPVINTTGLVRPNQGAMLSAQNAGTVSKVLVQNGQLVKKGDLLVELDSSVERASLQAAQAQLPALRQTYQRYANLLSSSAVSRQEVDNAKSAYDAQVANIESLKATIERRQIVAPFDGKAGIVKVNVGQYVNIGTEIVRVEDTSSMKIDFAISQNELDRLHLGQRVTATTDARQGETFSARITAIEPAINSSTGLVDVQATFDPEDGAKLLSGMFSRLRIALPTETNQIVVPQVAVSYNMYGEISYLLEPLSDEDKAKFADNPKLDSLYRAKQITVFTKDRQGIYSQLQGDEVKVGDKIITGGQQGIGNGSLVEWIKKDIVGGTEPAKKTNL
ncbi:multidrug efflux RND transporter periplasmic adaptor subunit AcrA [Rodentibacter trehalosifermentans]|uniref:Efflux transporter periplasmic adaptor subunit n=1 Tax=Rodentibacter trehalosifermentans TaxID=1908263 RepID=A0A1V3IRS2_9PAST|nr:efflux RND transporter periplasmic adaptor subunit [Rodentibacter trehalosifermentans]OOF44927.1 efflux transporter periplasmic adaptor subunit [Rodentibacter trehalosifermentans]OOF48892.1 efflux transporter periplasmic adaptor subunit [Rodentibacter trehalosifermentans]OOF52234.1 efflux transporter periplasmic adaptor subunit [Rodentibacter trehalosifermentans]